MIRIFLKDYALLDKIKPTEEMEKFRNEYYTKEVFGKWK